MDIQSESLPFEKTMEHTYDTMLNKKQSDKSLAGISLITIRSKGVIIFLMRMQKSIPQGWFSLNYKHYPRADNYVLSYFHSSKCHTDKVLEILSI